MTQLSPDAMAVVLGATLLLLIAVVIVCGLATATCLLTMLSVYLRVYDAAREMQCKATAAPPPPTTSAS